MSARRIAAAVLALMLLTGCGKSKDTPDDTKPTEIMEVSVEVENPEKSKEAGQPETEVPAASQEEADTDAPAETEGALAEEAGANDAAPDADNRTADPDPAQPEEQSAAAEEELLASQDEIRKLEKEIGRLEETVESRNETIHSQKKTILVVGICLGTMCLCLVCIMILLILRMTNQAKELARQRKKSNGMSIPSTYKPGEQVPAPMAAPVHAVSGVSGVSGVSVGKTHGQGAREYQQDMFTVSNPGEYAQYGVMAVVADGMGGLQDGDKVSNQAVTTAAETFYYAVGDPMERLIQILAAARKSVDDLQNRTGSMHSGTTMILGLVERSRFYYLSVGDSRICLYRNGILMNLNREHEYTNTLLTEAVNGKGSVQDAMSNPKGACLTNYLGMGEIEIVDIPSEGLQVVPGDKLVLMSDGVYKALRPEEIAYALQLPAQDAANALESSILAKGYGDQDNYTAIILECM